MRNWMRAAMAAIALAGAATWMVFTPSSVRAESRGPDMQAWWWIGNQGALAAPAPPYVGAHDLFIEGSKGNVGEPPVEPPAPFPSGVANRGAARAIAAVKYTIPSGAIVDRVKFKFAGSANPSVSVQACRTTAPFKAEQAGPWADVPAYDCTVPSIGSLSQDASGKTDGVVFTDIGGLVQGTTLSFVIVPDYYDNEDLQPPGADSLSFRGGAPTFDTGAIASEPTNSFDTGSPADTSGALSGQSSGLAPVPGLDTSQQSVPAAPTQATSPKRVARAVTPLLPGVSDRTARIVAGSGLVASMLAFALLIASESPRLRRVLGMRVATATSGPAGRGLGRFAQPREGRVPGLW